MIRNKKIKFAHAKIQQQRGTLAIKNFFTTKEIVKSNVSTISILP